MKRLWFAAMLLGLCFGSAQGSPSDCAYLEISQVSSDIPESHLCQVLCYAASYYGISEQEAEDAYDQGDLTINSITKNSYQVEYSGGLSEILVIETQ